MSYSYAPRQRASGGTSATVLAAKVAFASAALAAAASLARLAVPQLVSVAGAVLPRAWAVARFWLAPPYLFVTVHLIILVIWKLSDHKHFHAQAHAAKDPWPVAPHPPPAAAAGGGGEEAVRAKEDFAAAAAYREPLEPEAAPEFSPDSGGGESCVTTESDEDASSAPSYVSDVRHSLAPAHGHSFLEREPSLPPHAVDFDGEVEVDGDGDDDLDATWNAIMQKTRPAAAARAGPVGRRGGDEPAVRRLHQEEPQLLRPAVGAAPIPSQPPAAAARRVYMYCTSLVFLGVPPPPPKRSPERREAGRSKCHV